MSHVMLYATCKGARWLSGVTSKLLSTTENPRVSQASANHVLRSTAGNSIDDNNIGTLYRHCQYASTSTLSTTTGNLEIPRASGSPRPPVPLLLPCKCVYEYHGQRQQLPQSMTRHVGPAVPARSWPHDYLQTYLLLASSRTRQSAHAQSGCVY